MKPSIIKRTLHLAVSGLTAGFLAAGCVSSEPASALPPTLTPADRAAMQTRIFAASADVAFAATLAALQDAGWTIVRADRPSGLITAESRRRVEKLSPTEEQLTDPAKRQRAIRDRTSAADQWTRWEELTAHVEPWGTRVRERIVLTRRGALPPMTYFKRVRSGWLSRSQIVQVNAPANQESVEVVFPELYADWFSRITQTINQRQAQP